MPGAIFLILELDQPFGGLIRISSEPMLKCSAPARKMRRKETTILKQEVTEETEACEPCSLLLNQLAYLFALDRINRWIPSVTFISWKLISSPTGTFSSFM